MTVGRDQVSDIVKDILTKIRNATVMGGLISFEFSGHNPYVASKAIQNMLIDRGYVVYVLLGGRGSRTETMYIDLNRRRSLKNKAED
jgi:ribosomal protein S8